MHENLLRIKAVNNALKGLQQEYVFVGGAVVSLYATNSSLVAEIRPTDDVDVVVELATYSGYAELDGRLRSIGFSNDIESGVICRYRIQGIVVDVMSTNAEATGFTNRWYADGFKTAVDYQVDEAVIKIFSLAYFFSSKWEAFKNRGKGNYRTSKDFEDIVYILENVDDFEEQMATAPKGVIGYLKNEFSPIIDRDDFEEGLYSHLSRGYRLIDANYIKMRLKAAFNIR